MNTNTGWLFLFFYTMSMVWKKKGQDKNIFLTKNFSFLFLSERSIS